MCVLHLYSQWIDGAFFILLSFRFKGDANCEFARREGRMWLRRPLWLIVFAMLFAMKTVSWLVTQDFLSNDQIWFTGGSGFLLTVYPIPSLHGRHPNTFCSLVAVAAAVYQEKALFEVELQCALRHFSAVFLTCLKMVNLQQVLW